MADVKDTDWAYAAGFVDGEGCIAIVRSFVPSRDRFFYSVHIVVANNGRLGPYPMPQAWIDEQEKHYWIQRELNHRGNAAFVAKPMHSPRKIHRARLSEA